MPSKGFVPAGLRFYQHNNKTQTLGSFTTTESIDRCRESALSGSAEDSRVAQLSRERRGGGGKERGRGGGERERERERERVDEMAPPFPSDVWTIEQRRDSARPNLLQNKRKKGK